MTIQEKAIEQLERVSRHLTTIGEKEDYTGVAIQALEQECEDAVSRRAVLDIIKFEENWLFDAKSNNADTNIAFSGIRTQVAKLSPVTPIGPKGHWIDHSDEGYVECPNCGSATNCDGNIADLHFCFSCGAEMESEE